MKYLVEVQLKPGMKNQAVEEFEQRGPNRNPNIKFENAWLGAQSDTAFIVGVSSDESHVTEACRGWSAFGETKVHPVIDIEQY